MKLISTIISVLLLSSLPALAGDAVFPLKGNFDFGHKPQIQIVDDWPVVHDLRTAPNKPTTLVSQANYVPTDSWAIVKSMVFENDGLDLKNSKNTYVYRPEPPQEVRVSPASQLEPPSNFYPYFAR